MFIFLLNLHVDKFIYANIIKIGTKLTTLYMYEPEDVAWGQYQDIIFLTSQNDVILFYFLCQALLLISKIAISRALSKYIYRLSLPYKLCFKYRFERFVVKTCMCTLSRWKYNFILHWSCNSCAAALKICA